MKKAFAVVGGILAFAGAATMVIFFVETTTLPNPSVPPGNLSADIAANVPTNQLADASANTDPNAEITAAAFDTPTDASADASSSLDTPTSSDNAIATTTTAPAEPAPAPVTSAPTPTPAPAAITPPPNPTALQPTFAENTPATSTVATATITVTPTAPAPPPIPPAPQPSAQPVTPRVVAAGDLSLPYNEASFAGDNNWQNVWGVTNTTFSGYLDLSAGPASTGGAVYLKNADGWANYTMSATLDWLNGDMIDLLANYNGASNDVACEYTKTAPGVVTMQFVQYVNGNEIFLSPGAAIDWNGTASDLALSIKVDGVHGACSFNGQSISNDSIGPGISAMNAPGSGGVGFSVSDPTPDTSEIIVKQVSVTEN